MSVRVFVKGLTNLLVGNNSKYIVARRFTPFYIKEGTVYYEEIAKTSNHDTAKRIAKKTTLTFANSVVVITTGLPKDENAIEVLKEKKKAH